MTLNYCFSNSALVIVLILGAQWFNSVLHTVVLFCHKMPNSHLVSGQAAILEISSNYPIDSAALFSR